MCEVKTIDNDLPLIMILTTAQAQYLNQKVAQVHAKGLRILIERKQTLDETADIVRRQIGEGAANQLLQRVANEDLRGRAAVSDGCG